MIEEGKYHIQSVCCTCVVSVSRCTIPPYTQFNHICHYSIQTKPQCQSCREKEHIKLTQEITLNRPFRCKLSPRSESIKNRCYAHYRLYGLHPLVGKSYRRPVPVTQIRADLRRQQSSATAKSCHPESCLDWVSLSTAFCAVALLCWHLKSARICVTAIGRQ